MFPSISLSEICIGRWYFRFGEVVALGCMVDSVSDVLDEKNYSGGTGVSPLVWCTDL